MLDIVGSMVLAIVKSILIMLLGGAMVAIAFFLIQINQMLFPVSIAVGITGGFVTLTSIAYLQIEIISEGVLLGRNKVEAI